MAPVKNDWVYRFQVESPVKHKNGFTIYKLTSVVHPHNVPEAVTKLVVWKRYSDFKRFFKEVCDACKTFKISEKPPSITNGSFFNRFKEDVISERMRAAQALLEFVSRHKALFLGDTVQNFCEVGYSVSDVKTMGQAPVSGLDSREENIWRWTDDTRWRSDASQDSSSFKSDSSEDESVSADTAKSLQNNNFTEKIKTCEYDQSNNNAFVPVMEIANEETKLDSNDESTEVEDPAGPGDKPLSGLPPDDSAVVICQTEKPVSDIWMSVPTAEERLLAYRVVGIVGRLLLVTHRACPSRTLLLKVYRRSSWPVFQFQHVGEPRPIPHMVRLFDYIETEDAVFAILEYAPRGLLLDHAARVQELRVTPPLPDPSDATQVDVEVLVAHAQRLLASVTRTLQQSEAATSDLNEQLQGVESKLVGQTGRKPRSSSVTARARLERRYSCDDGKATRPRTAHPSLDRSVQWSRFSENTVRGWATALVAAVDTLHARGIIWGDLHLGNLLVGEGGTLLLSFHHRWHGVETALHPQARSGLFVAPEAYSVFPLTTAADWWSVGVILFRLFTGVELVEVHSCGIGSHTILEMPDFLSVEAKSLLTELLQYEPPQRLGSSMNGAEDIRCHPFFANVDWDTVYNLNKDA